MSNNIVEENPTAKPAAGAKPAGSAPAGGEDKVRKQARQLAYDVRYKVKQGFKDGQKTDPASLKQAYMSQLGKSPAPGPVKAAAKSMLIGEAYDFVDISEDIDNSISNVFGRVFVKKTVTDDADGNPAFEITDLMQEATDGKKYQVRVKDKKTGKSYTRYADRAKISELRKNPNIASVEMTGYGKPYEGEKNKGEQTAEVKSGKGLSKKDYDGDGKKETPEAEYKGSKDKAIKKALHKESGNQVEGYQRDPEQQGKERKRSKQTDPSKAGFTGISDDIGEIMRQNAAMKKAAAAKKVKKEEFIGEVNAEDQNPQANTKKIDVMKGKNTIKINPTQSEAKEWAKIAIANLQEKEVKVKDTKKVVDAIRAYDKSKDASKDADWDTEHGEKEKGDIEKKYAKKERGEIDKDDPNWKKKKYHTGMHGEDKNWGYDKDGKSLNPADQEEEERKDDELFGSPKGKKGKKKVKKESVDSVIAKILMGESGLEQQKAVEPPTKNLSKSPSQVDKLKKPDTEKQDVKSGPEIAVTFDGPNYPPATIDAEGDGRDMPTILNLIRNKWRAKGIRPLQMSNDMEGENLTEKKSKLPGETGNANAGTSVKSEKPAAPQQAEPEKEDPGIANKERRVGIMKRQILQKKMQAVRAGAGADIVAHHEPEGEQLDELNKGERVAAGQGKRAAKKGDWSKQKAKTGKRNINRFETKPVEREDGSLNKGKQSFKKVKVLNPKSGYSKKTDPTKGKVTSRKLSSTGTDLKPDYGPQKPHWAGNVHSDRAQQQRRAEHKARRGVKTKGTVASDIKKSMKEGKNWIQKAEKTMRKDKPCTGDKFGSETCPPGSKRYNLAKTFRKMAKEHHQKDANGKVIEHGDGTPSSVDEAKMEKGYISNLSKAQARNERRFGKKGSTTPQGYFGQKPSQAAELSAKRTAEHKARRGVKEEVISERQKDSEGQRLSQERGRSNYGKASVRNVRHTGTGGNAADPAERLVAMDARHKAHKEKRGVKTKGVKEDYYRGTGEKVVARTKKWMDKKGQKGAPGLDAMKARTAEHKAKRGVKEEVVGEGKKKGLDGKECWDGYKLAGTKKKGGKTVDNCVKVKEEVVTELNRYGKETGKATGSINKRAGTPVKKGGDTSDKALTYVRNMIRKETGKPEGQRKKVKGEKGRPQYGDRRGTPADTIAKRRQVRADAERLMRDTSGT